MNIHGYLDWVIIDLFLVNIKYLFQWDDSNLVLNSHP